MDELEKALKRDFPEATDAEISRFVSAYGNGRGNPERIRRGKSFIDRRATPESDSDDRRPERRQFGSSPSGLSEDGRELALAIDQYKVQQHRAWLQKMRRAQGAAPCSWDKIVYRHV